MSFTLRFLLYSYTFNRDGINVVLTTLLSTLIGFGRVLFSASLYLNILAISGDTKVYVLVSFSPKVLSLFETNFLYFTSPTYSPRLIGTLGIVDTRF